MTIIEHAEKHLGKIEQGWRDDSSGYELKVVSFKDSPGETVSTFLSLGMSNHILDLSEGKTVRQELVFSVYSIDISNMTVSFLMSLSESILDRGKSVLRGEVIPLTKELSEKIGFNSIYCTIPVFFDDDFCIYDGSTPSTVMVWVIPIYQSEVEYIAANGWGGFEDLLEERDPDLCSLERPPMI